MRRAVAISLQINQPPAISAPHAPFYTICTAIIFALFAFFAANIYTIYMFYTAQTLSPCRRTVCGDDALAALESLGDDESEVLGKRRENENIAPIPDLLKLFTKSG